MLPHPWELIAIIVHVFSMTVTEHPVPIIRVNELQCEAILLCPECPTD